MSTRTVPATHTGSLPRPARIRDIDPGVAFARLAALVSGWRARRIPADAHAPPE